MKQKLTSAQRRKFKVRKRVRHLTIKQGKPRLSIHRTNNGMYAQVIDDAQGVTLASACTTEQAVKKDIKGNGGNKDAAAKIGALIGERAKKAGVKAVIFDRGQFLYHGRVQVLADAAREAGLEF